MKCSKCGEALRDGDRFCVHCGAGVEAAPPPEAASQVEDCPECGAALKPGDRFCQKCGASAGEGITEKKTSRLSSPIETKYEALEEPKEALIPEVIPPGRAARPAAARPPNGPRRSNRTFYQLLGLAFVLIACGYLAYDYFVTPRHTATITVAQQAAGLSDQDPAAGPDAAPQTQTPATPPSVPATSRPAAAGRPAPPTNPPPQKKASPAPAVKQAAEPVRPAPQPVTPRPAPPVASAPVASAAVEAHAVDAPPVAAPTPAPAPAPASPSAQPAQRETVASNSPPARQPAGQPGTILLPGSQARRPPSKAAAPQAASPTPEPSRPATITAPAPPSPPALNEGIIYWTGKLEKNKVVVIENGQVNMGQISGNFFTGIPVDVHLPSPAVALVERPTPQNNWKRVAFRCLRSTGGSVTINIQWNLLR